MEWSEINNEDIGRALRSYRPVCWNCHLTASFRRASQAAVNLDIDNADQ
jgi:hypothetical protein